MITITLSPEEVGNILGALDRATEDLAYAATFPENDYDQAEVLQTTAEWQSLSLRLQAVLAAPASGHPFVPAEGDPGHCALCDEYDTDHGLGTSDCTECGES